MNLYQALAMIRRRRAAGGNIHLFDLYADGQQFGTFCARSKQEAVAHARNAQPGKTINVKEVRL